MYKKIIIPLTLLLSSPALTLAQTDRWYSISENPNMILYADISDIKKTQYPRTWFKFLVRNSKQKTLGYTNTMQLVQFDCANGSYTTIKLMQYKQEDLVLELPASGKHETPTPETFSEAMFKWSCPQQY